MLKFPGASRKTIPMQEVRQNNAVILACDATAQHLKTGGTIMPYGCPNVDRTTSTLQTCLCDVEGFTTMPSESHSFTNRRNRDSFVHTTSRKRSSVQKTWFWAQRCRASLLASDSKGFIGHLSETQHGYPVKTICNLVYTTLVEPTPKVAIGMHQKMMWVICHIACCRNSDFRCLIFQQRILK